jgi:hypothetical protein
MHGHELADHQRRQARRAGGQERLDGTYGGAPRAKRADASRRPSPSRTRTARPKMDVPGGALLAQARRSRAPLSRFIDLQIGTATNCYTGYRWSMRTC